jgi:hypothetical protein
VIVDGQSFVLFTWLFKWGHSLGWATGMKVDSIYLYLCGCILWRILMTKLNDFDIRWCNPDCEDIRIVWHCQDFVTSTHGDAKCSETFSDDRNQDFGGIKWWPMLSTFRLLERKRKPKDINLMKIQYKFTTKLLYLTL